MPYRPSHSGEMKYHRLFRPRFRYVKVKIPHVVLQVSLQGLMELKQQRQSPQTMFRRLKKKNNALKPPSITSITKIVR